MTASFLTDLVLEVSERVVGSDDGHSVEKPVLLYWLPGQRVQKRVRVLDHLVLLLVIFRIDVRSLLERDKQSKIKSLKVTTIV